MDMIQWDSLPSTLTWKEKIAYLSYLLISSGKATSDNPKVDHSFAPGVYIREMMIPKGHLFLGRAHRYGHLCQLVEGSIIMITQDKKIEMTAPAQVQTWPGYHMVLYSLTDVIGRTIHPNVAECRDTQGMEDDIFESADLMVARGKTLYEYHQMSIDRPIFEGNIIPFDRDYGVETAPSTIHGTGIKAKKDFKEGVCIAPAKLDGKHTQAGRYTNHSFRPNARFLCMDEGDLFLIAQRSITNGEEITVDYRDLNRVAK